MRPDGSGDAWGPCRRAVRPPVAGPVHLTIGMPENVPVHARRPGERFRAASA